MSGRSRRRVSEFLTGVASLTFPRARRADGRVVRDCAREAVDAAGLRGCRASACRSPSPVCGAGRARPRSSSGTPWRAALSALTLPLAAAILVVWIFGFIPRYDTRTLVAALGIALAVAVVATWPRNRTHPAHALATGLVLASVAHPLVWVAIRWEQIPTPYWAYNGAYPLLLAVLPLLLALVLMRRPGRT
jgi:hypothetical protein